MQVYRGFVLLSILASSCFASPAVNAHEKTVTVQLSNDRSGAYANVAVIADGKARPIEVLWEDTAVENNGIVEATSSQLVAFQQNSVCTISEEPTLKKTLNAQQTWVSLESGALVDLSSAFVTCK